jgi:hypothetical protein
MIINIEPTLGCACLGPREEAVKLSPYDSLFVNDLCE